LNFIIAASNLRAFNYGLKGETSRNYFVNKLKKIKVPQFVPKIGAKIATTDAELKQMETKSVEMDEYDSEVEHILQVLPKPPELAGYRLHPIEFDKDDDTNFHIQFITASSNIRARNYKFKEATKHETILIAGKVVPATATTTAMITGLVCLEIMKFLQKKPITAYRNSYVNLALPQFVSSQPLPPLTNKAILPTRELRWSLWDRIEIIGDITLTEFMKYFEKDHLEVNMLSYQGSLLYYNFGDGKKKKESRLAMRMSELICEVSKVKLKPSDRYVILDACVNDDQGEDVDIPYIRLKIY